MYFISKYITCLVHLATFGFDNVADCALATPQFGLPKINKLFDEVNKQTGATDSDLELYERRRGCIVRESRTASKCSISSGERFRSAPSPPPNIVVLEPSPLTAIMYRETLVESHY